MVYFSKLKFILHQNKILFKDDLIPGSIKISILPSIDGTEIHEINCVYHSKNDVTKFLDFGLKSNFLVQLKDQLTPRFGSSLQKVLDCVQSQKIICKLDTDPESDLLQATLNSFSITLSLILVISYLFRNEKILSELYNNFKIQLSEGPIDLSLANFNYLEKLCIIGRIINQIFPENWFVPLLELLKKFKVFFLNIDIQSDKALVLRQIYISLAEYYRWKNLSISQSIQSNTNNLLAKVIKFRQNIELAKNRYDELIDYSNQKIKDLNTYYNSQNINLYSNFVDITLKVDFQSLQKLTNNFELPPNFSLEDTIISIYDKISQILDKEKQDLVKDFISTKDINISETKKEIAELDLKLNNLILQRSNYQSELSQLKDQKEYRESSILEQKIKKSNQQIDAVKDNLVKTSKIIEEINRTKRSQNLDIETNISSKKSEVKEVLEKVKYDLSYCTKITKKYEFYRNQYIKTFVKTIHDFIEQIHLGLAKTEQGINPASKSDIILINLKKYLSLLQVTVELIAPIRDSNVNYNEYEIYLNEYNKIEPQIENVFSTLFEIYKEHDQYINLVLEDVYQVRTIGDLEFKFERISNTKIENVYFEKLEFELLVNLLGANLKRLEERKNILDNILAYYEKVKIWFPIQGPIQGLIREVAVIEEKMTQNNFILQNINPTSVPTSQTSQIQTLEQKTLNSDQKNEVIKLMESYINTNSDMMNNTIERFEQIEETIISLKNDRKDFDNKLEGLTVKLDKIMKLLTK